jgi:hypothetical protein
LRILQIELYANAGGGECAFEGGKSGFAEFAVGDGGIPASGDRGSSKARGVDENPEEVVAAGAGDARERSREGLSWKISGISDQRSRSKERRPAISDRETVGRKRENGGERRG